MRLSGHGLPHMQGNGHGDLYVSIQVNTPAHLTDHQKRLVQELAEAGL
jgi:DnaJ-class molecular chaperone